MKIAISLCALILIGGCVDQERRPMTFSCTSTSAENTHPDQTVLFHYAEGYLFIQNDRGGAENVCAQAGTIDCTVKMTLKELTFTQSVEDPYCDFRPALQTSLDIDRGSGVFRLLQQGCDPGEDIVITGICQSVEGKPE